MVPASRKLPAELKNWKDQPGDNQASLVYAVDIDTADPRTFQLLDLVGYPKRKEEDDEGKEVWALHHVDERFDSALELIDMTAHEGEHPRMGAVDVVPFIPLREIETEEAVERSSSFP